MGSAYWRVRYLLVLLACSLAFVACDLFSPPVEANLSVAPKVGRAPLKIEVDASASTGAVSYIFDPGDGSGLITRKAGFYDHIYDEPGRYEVKVTVVGADDSRSEATETIIVEKKVELPDLEPNEWTEIFPGGETVCSDGSEYSYFATPGKANKVVIDFQGGGACWTDYSCSRGSTGTYARNIWVTPEILKTGDINGDGVRDAGGIYDRENPQNPVADWYHVYVSYCTGDVHWGNATHTYTEIAGRRAGEDNVIQHKGAVNVEAILSWVYDNFEAPDTIFITGCSAGAYGAMMWTPHIAGHYPNAKIRLMADCGAGVVNQSFIDESLPKWNILEGAWPSFIPELDPDQADFEISPHFIDDLYIAIGKYLPESSLSQFNTMGDGNQIFYYGLMKGDLKDKDGDGVEEIVPTEATIREWLERMPASMAAIANGTDNYYSYLSMYDDNGNLLDGTGHCIIFRPEFYSLSESDVKLVDWLDDFINGRPVTSVKPKHVPSYDDIFGASFSENLLLAKTR